MISKPKSWLEVFKITSVLKCSWTKKKTNNQPKLSQSLKSFLFACLFRYFPLNIPPHNPPTISSFSRHHNYSSGSSPLCRISRFFLWSCHLLISDSSQITECLSPSQTSHLLPPLPCTSHMSKEAHVFLSPRAICAHWKAFPNLSSSSSTDYNSSAVGLVEYYACGQNIPWIRLAKGNSFNLQKFTLKSGWFRLPNSSFAFTSS